MSASPPQAGSGAAASTIGPTNVSWEAAGDACEARRSDESRDPYAVDKQSE